MPSPAQSSVWRQRLAALRAELLRRKLDAFLVPRQDEFQGEYVADYALRLKWLTGFSGSWGVAIVAKAKAAIFVDGRYTSQVRSETDSKLFTPQHLIDEPPAQWLCANLKPGSHVGFDPWLHSCGEIKRLGAQLAEKKISLRPVTDNPIDSIWHDQPQRPASTIINHPLRFAGVSTKDKLAAIRKDLAARKATATVLTDPAALAWAFNIRGQDVPFTPFVLAFAIIPLKGKAEIFADPRRLSAEARAALAGVAMFSDPASFKPALKALGKSKHTVLLDPASAPESIRLTLLAAKAKIIEGQDTCVMPRAQKNKVELAGARAAQIRDGVAMANFLCWLESEAPHGKLTEGAAADKLKTFRQATGELLDLSFDSISAAGPNAALPHYHAKGEGRRLRPNEIYLIDSGGQYRDGTTDVTRTVFIGEPPEEVKDRFTRVLKGMIGISTIRFPEGTTGAHIDGLARAALWKAGCDFDHGTGHGVGSYLSVHEGPARISKTGHVALKPGMILSNEPGYYKPGHYGIRTENLLIVTAPQKIQGGDRAMMGFETLTWVPISRQLIAQHLLTREELNWFNGYHAEVLKRLFPLVNPATKPWLEKACAPLN